MPTNETEDGLLRRHLNLVANSLLDRASLVQSLMGGSRDIDRDCNYPKGVVPRELYQELYDREPVAARVVEVYPKECWQVQPSVYEDEDSETETAFEAAWAGLTTSVRAEKSYHQDEQGSVLWEYLYRADVLSGIGHYGIILLGIDDGKDLSEPADLVAGSVSDEVTLAPEGTPWTPLPGTPEAGPIGETGPRLGKGSTDSTAYTKGARTAGFANGKNRSWSWNESGGNGGSKRGPKRNLTFLRVFPESMAWIDQFDSNPASPRFGQPIRYTLLFNDPAAQAAGVGLQMITAPVHWTRVIHAADNLASSEVFGVPRMQAVLNRLLDIRKIHGGSAEMYWRGAFPGYALETLPQLGSEVDIDEDKVKRMMWDWANGLQRHVLLTGLSMKSLSPQVTDPSPQVNTQIEAICIKLGVPVRIFKGSERGELASSQDDAAWNDRLKQRQAGYVTPRLIVPFVDRLIALGVLPAPEGYSVWWPDLTSKSDQEKAAIASQRTTGLVAYGNSAPTQDIITPTDYLIKVQGFDEAEAQSVVENAQAEKDKREKEQAKQQADQLKQQQDQADAEHQRQLELAKAKGPQQPPPGATGDGGEDGGTGGVPPTGPGGSPGGSSVADVGVQNYDPDQPREPAGTSGGGQFTKGSGSAKAPKVSLEGIHDPDVVERIHSTLAGLSSQYGLRLDSVTTNKMGGVSDSASAARMTTFTFSGGGSPITTSHHLELDPEVWQSKDSLKKFRASLADGYIADSSSVGMLRHEFAHALDKEHPEATPLIKEVYESYRDNPTVSTYSAHDHKEMLAEAFSYYLRQGSLEGSGLERLGPLFDSWKVSRTKPPATENYDPDQPRDESGKWSGAGDSSPAGGRPAVPVVTREETNSTGRKVVFFHVAEDEKSRIRAFVTPEALRIKSTFVSDTRRGQGWGTALYEEAAKYAHSKGLRLESDEFVSSDAVRVWDALARRGYEVTRHPATPDSEGGFNAVQDKGPVFSLSPPGVTHNYDPDQAGHLKRSADDLGLETDDLARPTTDQTTPEGTREPLRNAESGVTATRSDLETTNRGSLSALFPPGDPAVLEEFDLDLGLIGSTLTADDDLAADVAFFDPDLGPIANASGPATASPWSPYRGPRGGIGWKNINTGRIVYGGKQPGLGRGQTPVAPGAAGPGTTTLPTGTAPGQPKAQRADPATVKAHIAKLLANPSKITPDHIREVKEQLLSMTVAQIHSVRKDLGLKASGVKADLAAKVSQRALAGSGKPQSQPPTPAPTPPQHQPPTPVQHPTPTPSQHQPPTPAQHPTPAAAPAQHPTPPQHQPPAPAATPAPPASASAPSPLHRGSNVITGMPAPQHLPIVPHKDEIEWSTGKPQPGTLNGVDFAPAPHHFWEKVKDKDIGEPPPTRPIARAGVMVQEPDGRIWIAKPTNEFGDRKYTMPGGGVEHGLTHQQNAMKEVWEETGLQVEITGHLGDFRDSNTGNIGRMYIGKRVGGAPWDAKIEPHIIDQKTGKPAAESSEVVLATPERARKLLHRSDDLAQLMTAAPIPLSTPTRGRGSEPMEKLVEAIQPKAEAYKQAKKAAGQSPGIADLHAVQELRGFNEKPQVLPKKDMDALIAKGDHIEVLRGLQADAMSHPTKTWTAEKLADDFRYGDHYPGFGVFGAGTYTDGTKGRDNIAFTYASGAGQVAGGGSSAILRMAIPRDAKIVKFSELNSKVPDAPLAFTGKGRSSNESQDWLGLHAALAGYDAIHMDQPGFGHNFYVILNRGVVTVQKEDASGHMIK